LYLNFSAFEKNENNCYHFSVFSCFSFPLDHLMELSFDLVSQNKTKNQRKLTKCSHRCTFL
jgi:hypothetical protein